MAETGGPLYVLKNNEMSAVLISPGEYALLREAEEIVEHLEIAGSIKKGCVNSILQRMLGGTK